MALGAASSRFTLVKGGLVVDPAAGIDRAPVDLLLEGERVVEIGENLTGDVPKQDVFEFDATGCLVCPGLVDLHTHCFPGATPLGVVPDDYCLRRGVTTVVDAGSAGQSVSNCRCYTYAQCAVLVVTRGVQPVYSTSVHVYLH